MIFISDEGIYPNLTCEDAKKWAQTTEDKKRWSREEIFKRLTAKFSVYVIRKPYLRHSDTRSEADLNNEKQWASLIGADRVCSLPAADRVVDVIFGILARETGRIEYFEKELKDRQGKDVGGDKKIDIVMKSLYTIHNIPKDSLKKIAGPKGAKSKSITPGKSKKGGGKSISLLDD